MLCRPHTHMRVAQGQSPRPDKANGGGARTLDGVGYYVLRAGTQLRLHAGPSNERLTCHLTLEHHGEGAVFTVGGEPRPWRVGQAFCFDDSFLHEAVNLGLEDRYVLLLDLPHPDLLLANPKSLAAPVTTSLAQHAGRNEVRA